jgi:hypothetical protein
MTHQIPQPEDSRATITRLEKKVDFLILQVDRLNKTINPPIWKKAVRWIWRHWFTITILLVIGFIAWNAWEEFQILNAKIEEIQAMPSRAIGEIQSLPGRATESLWDAVEKVKFW